MTQVSLYQSVYDCVYNTVYAVSVASLGMFVNCHTLVGHTVVTIKSHMLQLYFF